MRKRRPDTWPCINCGGVRQGQPPGGQVMGVVMGVMVVMGVVMVMGW